MEFTKLEASDVIGTSLRGYTITTSRAELEEIFGQPTEIDDSKTTIEWDIRFEDGTIAAIYDWKLDTTPDYYEELEFNVGGDSVMSAIHVNDVIVAHRDALVTS